MIGVDQPLPKEARRINTALAGRSVETQRCILQILDEALQLDGK